MSLCLSVLNAPRKNGWCFEFLSVCSVCLPLCFPVVARAMVVHSCVMFLALCLDIEPPKFTFCPKSQTETTKENIKLVTWQPPQAMDNSGVQPRVESNRNSGSKFAVPGQYEIEIVASDESRNTAVCSFTITLKSALFPLVIWVKIICSHRSQCVRPRICPDSSLYYLEKCIGEVLRIDNVIIVHGSKLWNARYVRLRRDVPRYGLGATSGQSRSVCRLTFTRYWKCLPDVLRTAPCLWRFANEYWRHPPVPGIHDIDDTVRVWHRAVTWF